MATLIGTEGADILSGTASSDLLQGLGGDDDLYGREGDDTLEGGAGNDELYVMAESITEAERLDGGGGDDVLHWAPGSGAGDQVVVLDGGASGSVQWVAMERLNFNGWNGNDSAVGGAGADHLWGGDGNDTLRGGGGDDRLWGSNGNDHVYGDGGNDWIGVYFKDVAEVVDGGAGIDTLSIDTSYAGQDALVVVMGTGSGTWRGVSFSNFERLECGGSDAGDTLVGGAWNDDLFGAWGNDSLVGGDGADELWGGAHADTLRGGAGDDVLGDGDDGDLLDGGGGNDSFIISSEIGDFTVLGGSGLDTMRMEGRPQADYEVETLPDGTIQITYTGSRDWIDGSFVMHDVELLKFSDATQVLGAGSSGNDTVDLLGPGGGSFAGGAGNDTYLVDEAQDQPVEEATGGNDTVIANLAWTLGANLENLVLGGAAPINGSGNALANRLQGNAAANLLSGAEGNDFLKGGGGADTLQGGAGDDNYVAASGVVIAESRGAGTDTISSAIAWTLPANVETLVLTGARSVNGTGNAAANALTGNAGNNALKGLGGADTLRGLDGNDVLRGGAGNDTLEGGAGADSFVFDTALSSIDRILDFTPAEDGIRLDASFFGALGAGALPAEQFLATSGTPVATSANQHVLYDTSTGSLYYDADGNDAGAAIRFAVLGNATHPVLDAGDILIVA